MSNTSLKKNFYQYQSSQLRIIVILVCLFIFTTCEDYNQIDYEEHVVLEAYATAHQPLPEVRLSRTLPTGQEYSFAEAGLGGATVQITLLNDNGGDEADFDYHPSSEVRGLYVPDNQSHHVLPRRSYRIDVDFDNRSDVLSAQTTIPDNIEIINDVPDTLVYQSSQQLETVLAPIEQTGKQNVFVFNAIALQPEKENLTPLYRDLVENEDENIEELYNNDSGTIKEDYEVNQDGTITIKYPWIIVAFFGDNQIVANSIDKNLLDLLNSQSVQLGGGTLSPGEIPNLNYHIEGGIGVFGSFASDTVQTFFKRPEPM